MNINKITQQDLDAMTDEEFVRWALNAGVSGDVVEIDKGESGIGHYPLGSVAREFRAEHKLDADEQRDMWDVLNEIGEIGNNRGEAR